MFTVLSNVFSFYTGPRVQGSPELESFWNMLLRFSLQMIAHVAAGCLLALGPNLFYDLFPVGFLG